MNEKKLYFVTETKGSLEEEDLHKKEEMKIHCGSKHFEEFKKVTFKKVSKVEELM
jgi:type III restriction enzyme